MVTRSELRFSIAAVWLCVCQCCIGQDAFTVSALSRLYFKERCMHSPHVATLGTDNVHEFYTRNAPANLLLATELRDHISDIAQRRLNLSSCPLRLATYTR